MNERVNERLDRDEQRRYQAAQVRLFAYMHERGVRPSWLAQRLGVTRARVCQYERRGDAMPFYRFEVACRALDVTPERFGWQSLGTARKTKRAS